MRHAALDSCWILLSPLYNFVLEFFDLVWVEAPQAALACVATSARILDLFERFVQRQVVTHRILKIKPCS